jgi:hypothetical protein
MSSLEERPVWRYRLAMLKHHLPYFEKGLTDGYTFTAKSSCSEFSFVAGVLEPLRNSSMWIHHQ